MKPVRVEISYKTIIFIFALLAGIALLWQLKTLLITLFVCFIVMEALNPTVTRLERFHIPRALAILLIYIVIIVIIGIAVAGIVPAVIEQSAGLIQTIPQAVSNIKVMGYNAIDFNNQFKILDTLPSEIAKATLSIFSNVFTALVVLVISFYLLMERRHFSQHSYRFFGHDGKDKFLKIIDSLEQNLGNWIVAEIILMTVVGLLSFIAFTIIGLPYALPLAIIAGLLEIVPSIGPTASTALAVLIGLSVSPLTAVLALICGVIVQQLENNLLVPKVMSDKVGLNPLVTIVVITSGATIGGVIGAIMAIPVYITIQVIVKTLYSDKLSSPTPTKKTFGETGKLDSV